MKLVVNGKAHDLPASMLSEALDRLDYNEIFIATALNGDFVPARLRATTPLNEGDRIEILRPMQGG